MLVYPLRTKDSFILLTLVFLCLFLFASCSETTNSTEDFQGFFKFTKSSTEFDLVDENRFEISDLVFSADGKGKLLVKYTKAQLGNGEKLGVFIKLSNDGGKSFGQERALKAMFRSDRDFNFYDFRFDQDGGAFLLTKNRNIFYSRTDRSFERLNEPIQINDEEGASAHSAKFLQSVGNKVSAVWVDRRLGFELVFFSNSADGGKTWSPNKAVDYDFREGKQGRPILVAGAKGRLLLFWQDWRDRKTLSDIRFSFSDNQGKTWAPSKKINDDEQEVWQTAPAVVSKGSQIYVVFADFREKGGEDDNEWNIYFTSSIDNGDSWEKNKRLNGTSEGQDLVPALSIDEEGVIYCAWWTARKTLFGQIAFSYSGNGGKSWSPEVMLTSRDEIQEESFVAMQVVSNEKLLTRWVNLKNETRKSVYSFIEKSSDPIERIDNVEKDEPFTPIKTKVGDVLFFDDFSNDSDRKWDPLDGRWSFVGGSYMGSKPGNSNERFVSFAKLLEPDRYVMKGRFKLDSTAHISASIYFRVDKEGLRHYVVKNQFRKGAWLSVKTDNSRPDGNTLGGRPLIQKRFSFRQDRWYDFKLVVTTDHIDYYVNDKLMLSYDKKLLLEKGRIGIGGHTNAPTYFDDISIAELKE